MNLCFESWNVTVSCEELEHTSLVGYLYEYRKVKNETEQSRDDAETFMVPPQTVLTFKESFLLCIIFA